MYNMDLAAQIDSYRNMQLNEYLSDNEDMDMCAFCGTYIKSDYLYKYSLPTINEGKECLYCDECIDNYEE